MKPLLARCVALLMLGLLLNAELLAVSSSAQTGTHDWPPPTRIYTTTNIERPVLAPDPSGALHALWGGPTADQPEDAPWVIMYARWDGQRWSQPADVMVDPDGRNARLPEAAVDASGTLHIVWTAGQLYYSAAPAWAAEDPRRWSEPQEIGGGKNVGTPAGLDIAPDGSLHVVLAASATREVYHTSSEDGGQSWSNPNLVYATEEATTSFARLAIDRKGTLHAIWALNTLPDGYPPLGVLYAHSEDRGFSWSQPVQLAGVDYGEGSLGVGPDGTVHVVYNGRAGVAGRYHHWSRDGGETWTGPAQAMPTTYGGGLTGNPGLASDSAGSLYLISGDAAFSEWRDGTWSAPKHLTELWPVKFFHIEQPALAVVGGNQLHAFFWQDAQSLWHTWRYTDATAQTPVPYPTATLALSPEATAADASVSEQAGLTSTALPATESIDPGNSSDPIAVILLSVGPSVLLVAGVLLIKLAGRRT